MVYTSWTAMQLPNPNSSRTDTHYSSYYPHLQPQNPNPDSHLQNGPHYADPALKPPGVGPYSYSQTGSAVYPHHQPVVAGSVAVQYAYYQDPNAAALVQNWAVQQYGSNPYVTGATVPPNGTEQSVPAISSSTLWMNQTIQPRAKNTWKRAPKKTKVVQSVWCEVCKIDCNTKEVLDQHKLGKKHKKNLDKLKAAIVPPPPPPVTLAKPDNKPLIGPQENPSKGKSSRSKKKKAESAEDLETKRRKVLEGGAAVEAVRTCSVCNVVCNSDTVFRYHLTGAKHVALVKKLEAGTAMGTAT